MPAPDPENIAARLFSDGLWISVAFLVLGAFWGVAFTIVNGREVQRKLEEDIAAAKEAEQAAAWGYNPYGTKSILRGIETAMLENSLEKDRGERRQTVANIIFATLFVCAGLATGAVFLRRPPSLYQTAVLWGSLAAAGLGLIGAVLSQYAPLWSHPLAGRAYSLTPFQLSYLASHTFLCGLVGAAIGAGVGVMRLRSQPVS